MVVVVLSSRRLNQAYEAHALISINDQCQILYVHRRCLRELLMPKVTEITTDPFSYYINIQPNPIKSNQIKSLHANGGISIAIFQLQNFSKKSHTKVQTSPATKSDVCLPIAIRDSPGLLR